MTHLDTQLQILRSDLIDMWNHVISQLERAREAIESNDMNVVSEMAATEKMIDAYELKVDMDCENILALFSPLANDLRLVLAILKTNYNLERIGDFAWGIAKTLKEITRPFDKESLTKICLPDVFETGIEMLKDALKAFETEDNQLARGIFQKDETIDIHNKEAFKIIADLIAKNPKEVINYLYLLTTIRKMERVGDHTKNISEEIIFYLEAKVLRHKKKKNI
jgi:phosphate transport system protein